MLSAQAQFARIGGVGWDEDEDRPANVKRLGDAPRFPLSLPRANTKKGDGQTYRDLTSHFWAGLPVTVTLEAHDQGGQIGSASRSASIFHSAISASRWHGP